MTMEHAECCECDACVRPRFTLVTDSPSTWPPIQGDYVLVFTPPISANNNMAHFHPTVEYIYSKLTCEGLEGSYWRSLDTGDFPEGMAP